MPTKAAQNPLILNYHRLMEAFAKSDDERDFYVDKVEGFIIFVDLDKDQKELDALQGELIKSKERYCLVPKLTFYETKKIMEGFVNEKVFDIDTKEKLMDIIQSKEAREHFLEFIYDNHTELEKWQQFYQERFRIRIIEWLRIHSFTFVFEEDLDLTKNVVEKLKKSLFSPKVGNDVAQARKVLEAKSKTYYSSEALNPRPKRGRPPKQVAKVEIEPKVTCDIFTKVPPVVHPFLFVPDITSPSSVTFSSKFENEEELMASLRNQGGARPSTSKLEALNEKLQSLRTLSSRFALDSNLDIPEPLSAEASHLSQQLGEENLVLNNEPSSKRPSSARNGNKQPETPKKRQVPKKIAKKVPAKKVATKKAKKLPLKKLRKTK